jgi:starch-binding outer membrane protein, SusD/RagB family
MIALRSATLRIGWKLAGILALSGCGLLDTESPVIIDPNNLESPEGAEARRFGAIRDFGFVRDGDGSETDTEGLITLTGSMADEFNYSGFLPSVVEFDQRLVVNNNPSLTPLYFRLHVARSGAEGAAAALERWSPDPDNDPGIPEMLALAGFTYVFFAEDFCSWVPYSSVDENGEQVFGPSRTTDETLGLAIARFDAALAHGGVAADPSIGFLAAVGKGRALVDRGLYADAVTAVQAVPTEFEYLTEHDPSPLSLANAVAVFGISESGGSISVADVEGGDGLPYRGAADPRLPFEDTGHLGDDQTTPQFNVLKYPELGSSVVLADGVEARLIEAEALLQVADYPAMNTTLNELRATVSLPPLAAPGTEDEAVDQLFSERGLWLYATAHRLGDMRRLVRQYGRPIESVYPVGDYIRGGSYGTRVAIPIPETENNNPQFDRSACDPNAA